jgi:hypothetical protein
MRLGSLVREGYPGQTKRSIAMAGAGTPGIRRFGIRIADLIRRPGEIADPLLSLAEIAL